MRGQAFACLSLLSLAAAAPAGPVLLAHHAPVHHAVVGGQTSHQSVSRPGQEVSEMRTQEVVLTTWILTQSLIMMTNK